MITILTDESFSRAKLCFRFLTMEKFRRSISGKSVNAVSDKYVESGKATARIESDGYKKKLLASQTHLDLQTVLALALPSSFSLSPLVSILAFFLSRYPPAISLYPFSLLYWVYLLPLPSFPKTAPAISRFRCSTLVTWIIDALHSLPQLTVLHPLPVQRR